MSIDPTSPAPSPVAARSTPRTRDVVTVGLLLGSVLLLFLPLGLVLATMAWSVGAALLWTSTSWSPRDMAVGTLVWPGGLIGPVLLATMPGQVCTRTVESNVGLSSQVVGDPVCTGFALSPWVGLPLGIVVLAAPFVVAILLLNRAGRS